MGKILVRNTQCKIVNETNLKLLGIIDRELSFNVQGAQYSPQYKYGRWDGTYRLLSESLVFSYGLLPRVLKIYSKNNVEVEIEDQRDQKSLNSKIDISSKLKELKKIPRDYQLQAVEACEKNDCGILRLATGAGKTVLSALITAHFGKRTIIYVIGNDLLYQTHKLFSDIFGMKIGIVGDGLCEIADINVASIWTVGQALGLKKKDILIDEDSDEKDLSIDKYASIRQMLTDAKVQIFDECHVASCATIKAIVANIDPEHVYGMSASPWRDDGSDLLIEAALGKNIIDIPASYLIERGYLVKPTITFKNVPPLESLSSKVYKAIYKEYITDNKFRNDLIINSTLELNEKNYKSLVLFNNISHGNTIYNEMKNKIPCSIISGKDSTDERQRARDDLESGKIKAILASKIYDIGVDIPFISGLVLGGGGKSSVRALQRIGRVIRPFENKNDAQVVEFYDNAHFLRDHAKKRIEIYRSEPAFDVNVPKQKR